MPLDRIDTEERHSSRKKAIVFVHGLNGSRETWIGDKNRWVDRLMTEPDIRQNFGFFLFTYATQIFEPLSILKRTLSLLPGNERKRFNTGVRDISNELSTAVTNVLHDYHEVILISHSLGGLVCKHMLANTEASCTNVPLFVSLSVPHLGSQWAIIGKRLFRNPQIPDLAAFGQFTSDLQQRYDRLQVKPKTIYQRGTQDLIVPESSAIPAGTAGTDWIFTDDDHYSVLSQTNPKQSSIYVRVLRELSAIIEEHGDCATINKPITVEVPKGTSFRDAVQILLDRTGASFDFEGFGETETYVLEGGTLERPNTYQALRDLAHLSRHMPHYQIKLKRCHFTITKTT